MEGAIRLISLDKLRLTSLFKSSSMFPFDSSVEPTFGSMAWATVPCESTSVHSNSVSSLIYSYATAILFSDGISFKFFDRNSVN